MQNVVDLAEPGSTAQLGRYRLIATLGQGGMGAIRLAVAGGFAGFRKLFVLKILKEQLACDEKFVEMFMHEATLAARLSHPNVVQTLEAGQLDGRYFLVMEFLDGQPFSEVMRRAESDQADSLALRLQMLCDALTGLHYAHELTDYDGRALHLVHRDVSPANVFVTYDGQVKLLDFGIAKAHDSEETRPGQFKGKVGYAAPEQFRGQPADRRVDVFAAGVVLWETIALRHLVRGKSARAIVEARLAGTEPRIGQVVEEVDPLLAAICDRAMHNDPEQRYPTADALRRALQDYLIAGGESVSTGALKQWMRSKFASERATMHRLIDQQLRAIGDGEPLLEAWTLSERASTPGAPPVRNDELSLDSVTDDLPAPEPIARAPQKRVLLWGSAAAASLFALVLGSIQLRATNSARELEAGTARAPQVTPPAPDPTAAADTRVPPAAGLASRAQPGTSEVGSGAEQPLARAVLSDEQAATRATLDDEQTLRPARPSIRIESAREQPLRGRANVEARGPGRLRVVDVDTPENLRDAAAASSESPPARERLRKRGSQKGGAAQLPSSEASADPNELDLRHVPRRERRQLDVDNPFR
jgi:serine/threonine protein kinase